MNDPQAQSLDAALDLIRIAPGVYEVATSEVYWNMAGPFGGWIFAAGIKAIQSEPGARGTPIEAHARFMNAPRRGKVRLQVNCPQQGRSVGFWRATLDQVEQDGSVRLCAEIFVTLAAARQSIDALAWPMPAVPPPDRFQDGALPVAPTVSWLGRYRFRYITGFPFFLGGAKADTQHLDTRYWVAETEPRALDCINLTALADTPVPRIFLLQKSPSPVATVSMSVYFHQSTQELAALPPGWILADIGAHSVRHGFFDHRVSLWHESGVLLASSTQVAWFN